VQDGSMKLTKFYDSLFSHAMSMKKAKSLSVMLNEQYRMDSLIAAFPNEKFYEGKLKTAKQVEQRALPWNAAIVGGDLKEVQQVYMFWDTSAVAFSKSRYRDVRLKDDTSRFNLGEIDVVVKLLQDLDKTVREKPDKRGTGKWGVFVLSPYQTQVSPACLCVCCQ
jgi:superfamily I DNA and/or RNA helicase